MRFDWQLQANLKPIIRERSTVGMGCVTALLSCLLIGRMQMCPKMVDWESRGSAVRKRNWFILFFHSPFEYDTITYTVIYVPSLFVQMVAPYYPSNLICIVFWNIKMQSLHAQFIEMCNSAEISGQGNEWQEEYANKLICMSNLIPSNQGLGGVGMQCVIKDMWSGY